MNSLGEGFLQRYESKAEKPNSSSADAKELCRQFFDAGSDATTLNKYSNLAHLDKHYADAIEQLYPVLLEANS